MGVNGEWIGDIDIEQMDAVSETNLQLHGNLFKERRKCARTKANVYLKTCWMHVHTSS